MDFFTTHRGNFLQKSAGIAPKIAFFLRLQFGKKYGEKKVTNSYVR
jgi:hypothetical protein